MNKNGFTLAEVLVTLGIIGVVAALAMPALNASVQKTRVGPSLRKFMNTIENANRMVMQENDTDDLSTVATTRAKYTTQINKFLAGGSYDSAENDIVVNGGDSKKSYIYTMGSGEEFYISMPDSDKNRSAKAGTNYKGKLFWLLYDMNGLGADKKPNKYGKDQFLFYIDNNGAVIPVGSKAAGNAYTNEAGDGSEVVVDKNSTDNTAKNCADTTGKEACQTKYAAGAIANNGWKVGYKY